MLIVIYLFLASCVYIMRRVAPVCLPGSACVNAQPRFYQYSLTTYSPLATNYYHLRVRYL